MNGLYYWQLDYYAGACQLISDTVPVVVSDIPTGIADANPGRLFLWPNPANDRLRVAWSMNGPPVGVRILDATGRPHPAHIVWNHAERSAVIGVHGLAPGCYFVELDFAQGRHTAGFVRE